MRSIRARLNAGLIGVLALVFTAGGFAVHGILRAAMEHEVERSLLAFLRSEVGPILHEAMPDGGPLSRPRDDDPRRPPRPPFAPMRTPLLDPVLRTDFLFQVWRGEETARSRALAGELPRAAASLATVDFEALTQQDGLCSTLQLPLEGGTVPARALAVKIRPPERPGFPRERGAPPEFEIVVARPTMEVEETLATVRRVLWLVGLGGGVASSLLLLAVVRRGLRPLEDLRAALATLDVARLDAELAQSDPVAELEPVVAQLEALLARVQGELRRAQAFSADVAHELRTPLAGIRATLEVLLSRRREPEAWERGARDSLAIAAQMQTLVERLLEFARPSGSRGLAATDLDAAALVTRTWGALEGSARERSLHLAADLDEPAPLRSDERLVERVLANLLENAVAYADPDSTVELRLARTADGIRLELSNAARGASPEHAARAFDPFWRADESRTATGVHAGLGLSLCQRIVEELGGHLRAAVEAGRFRIELELPDLPATSGVGPPGTPVLTG